MTYIKREDAIDYLVTNMNWFDADGIETSEEEKRADITELVNGVPSADVAPVRHGRWVFAGDNMFECLRCGVVYTLQQLDGLRNYDTDHCLPNYCPNCGARMGGESDDE